MLVGRDSQSQVSKLLARCPPEAHWTDHIPDGWRAPAGRQLHSHPHENMHTFSGGLSQMHTHSHSVLRYYKALRNTATLYDFQIEMFNMVLQYFCHLAMGSRAIQWHTTQTSSQLCITVIQLCINWTKPIFVFQTFWCSNCGSFKHSLMWVKWLIQTFIFQITKKSSKGFRCYPSIMGLLTMNLLVRNHAVWCERWSKMDLLSTSSE